LNSIVKSERIREFDNTTVISIQDNINIINPIATTIPINNNPILYSKQSNNNLIILTPDPSDIQKKI